MDIHLLFCKRDVQTTLDDTAWLCDAPHCSQIRLEWKRGFRMWYQLDHRTRWSIFLDRDGKPSRALSANCHRKGSRRSLVTWLPVPRGHSRTKLCNSCRARWLLSNVWPKNELKVHYSWIKRMCGLRLCDQSSWTEHLHKQRGSQWRVDSKHRPGLAAWKARK